MAANWASNLTLAELHGQYDAVFLGLGLDASRSLGLTGEDAPGLLAAVDYIAALRQADDLTRLPVPRRAIVIGAGNTAIDMAVQIKRLGAEDVTLVYRRGFESMSGDRPRTGHRQGQLRAHADLGRAAGSAAGRSRPRARHAL